MSSFTTVKTAFGVRHHEHVVDVLVRDLTVDLRPAPPPSALCRTPSTSNPTHTCSESVGSIEIPVGRGCRR
jgi:hypothetical protein